MKIDMFGHGMSRVLRDRVLERFSRAEGSLANWYELDPLFDEDRRLGLLDANEIDVQVLTAPSPPLETLFDGDELREMSRLANDSMAELVDSSGGRLRGTVSVPLCDPEFAVGEVRRGVESLGLLGPQIFTSSRGRPLDHSSLEGFWSELERLGVPAWMHPERRASQADYPDEDGSLYSLFLVLGWPYESSVAMTRLVFSGVLERHPDLNIIVHHAGAMIPFFRLRIDAHYPEGEQLGRIDGPQITTPLLDGFRRFYVDTAIHGPVSSLMAAHEFFGADHMVMGTDTPFGPRQGADFCRWGSGVIDDLPISDEERAQIRSENALRLARID